MAPRFPIQRDQKKRKTSDSSSNKANFDSNGFRSKKCEEYYATMHKRGILLKAWPTWRNLRDQNQQPDTNEQKWGSLPYEMEVVHRKWQIHMEKDQRLENHMRDLWEDLNLNVVPPSKRTAEEVAQFVDWRPFGGHPITLEERSQEDDTEEEDESEEDNGEEEDETEEGDEYEMKEAVILHNKDALLRMCQVSIENRQRLKEIARQMYECLRRNDPPITDMKDEEVACLVNWAEFIWRTFFNT